MTDAETTAALEQYSRAEISAMQLRRALGGITYGDVLMALAKHDLSLPHSPQPGSQERIARARAVLFPLTS